METKLYETSFYIWIGADRLGVRTIIGEALLSESVIRVIIIRPVTGISQFSV